MNKTPSILVDTGFEVDQSGTLTEIVMPKVVTTCSAPRKVTFEGQVLNWIPSTTAALQEIVVHSSSFTKNSMFKGYNALTTATFPNVSALDANPSGVASSGHFNGCIALTTVNFPKLTSIGQASTGTNTSGHFNGCTSLTTVNMPLLTTIGLANSAGNYNGTFWGCTALSEVTLPSIVSIGAGNSANNGNFGNCTGLSSVQLGSPGHPVSSIGAYTFTNCTQSNLTLTIYTNGGAALSGSPWGATNTQPDFVEA